MNWALVILTASSLQTVGYYDRQNSCQTAAKEWRDQGVKAVCTQQMSPDQAVDIMQRMIKIMLVAPVDQK